MKKIMVVKYGYEYDDNFYNHDGKIDINKCNIFDDIEKAEEFKKAKTKYELFNHPTNGDLYNVLDGIDENNIDLLASFLGIEKEENYYNHLTITKKHLTKKKYAELYPIIKDLYFKIVEIEIENNSNVELEWKSNYSKTKFLGIIKDDKFELHSSTKPAIIEKDDYEVYKEYYLKGKKYEKKQDWISESRKYKIDNILKEETEDNI